MATANSTERYGRFIDLRKGWFDIKVTYRVEWFEEVMYLWRILFLGVHGSAHRNINLIERTNKMLPCSRIYYSNVSYLLSSGNRQPKTYVKPEATITVFELLMMGGVSPETCWAIKKHGNNKFCYTVASCWLFLWDLYYNARIHKHQVSSLSTGICFVRLLSA